MEKLLFDDRIKYFKCILVDYVKDNRIKEKITDLLKYMNQLDLIDSLVEWQIPHFPINGNMIASKNIPKGPLYTRVLNELRDLWKFEFHMDNSQTTINALLKKCDEIIS